MSDTGSFHRCRRCHAISTGPCCSKCKAPHVDACDKDYVPWRMSFDNRALGTNIVECVRIDPNTGLPFAVVPGGGLGFPGDGSYPGFTNIPTDTDPPSPDIPAPPTDLEPDPDPDAPPGGIGDRSLVSLPTSCGGDPVSFDFTVYGGVGMPYLTVNWDAGGQAMPGAMVITDALGNVIAACDVLTPPAGGQVLTATFTPDAGCELVGFTGTPAPSGNYNGQVVTNQYKASPSDCPNTTPDATGTKAVTVSFDMPTPEIRLTLIDPAVPTYLIENIGDVGSVLNWQTVPPGVMGGPSIIPSDVPLPGYMYSGPENGQVHNPVVPGDTIYVDANITDGSGGLPAPGTYSGTMTVKDSVFSITPVSVPVTMTVPP